jgi:arabinofuranosyltransferase
MSRFAKRDTLWGGLETTALVVFFTLTALVVLSACLNSLFPVDDAYIGFRYSRNWANGLGLVFNPGERVEAYSNFLWVALIGVGSFLGLSEAVTARVLSLFALGLTCLVLFRLARRVCGEERGRLLPLAAALSFLLLPGTVFHALSGLETIATCLLLLIVATVMRSSQPGRRRAIWLGLALALYSLNRPEGILLALLMVVAELGLRAAGPLASLARRRFHWPTVEDGRSGTLSSGLSVGPLVAVYGGVVGLFLLWRIAYYGALIPNSVTAKSGGVTLAILEGGASYLFLRFVCFYAPLLIVATVSVVRADLRDIVGFRIPLALTLGLTVALGGASDGYPYARYLFPLVPLLILWGLEGALFIWESSRGLLRPWPARGFAALLATVLILTQGLLSFAEYRINGIAYGKARPLAAKLVRFFAPDRSPHLDTGPIRAGLGHHQLAAWLAAHAGPQDVLATYEIGVAPYYTGIRVLDLFGLANAEIARRPGPPGARADDDKVLDSAPKYVALRVPADCLCGHGSFFYNPRLRDDYDLVAFFPYWSTEILLFERRPAPVRPLVRELDLPVDARPIGRAWLPMRAEPPGAVSRVERLQILAPLQREWLFSQIHDASGSGADFRRASAMRTWMGTWRRAYFVSSTPGGATLVCDLTAPPGATLAFGWGAGAPGGSPPDPRSGIEVTVQPSGEQAERVFFRGVTRISPPGGWQDCEVDLSRFGGKSIRLAFTITNAGTRADIGLAAPRIVIRAGD